MHPTLDAAARELEAAANERLAAETGLHDEIHDLVTDPTFRTELCAFATREGYTDLVWYLERYERALTAHSRRTEEFLREQQHHPE